MEDCGVEGILAQSNGSVIRQEQVGYPTIGGYWKTNDLRNVCTGKDPFIQRGSSENSYTHAWGANFAHLLCMGPGGHQALGKQAGTAKGGLWWHQALKGCCAFP